ncbi:hypothetical protein BO70DRAFT_394345 [Aspergillus heteromorphus CBS 117.55]|uniref:Uncharacterized protein n=1 Tax=Aspergillus heteromorphus CBS 117.55 TaxID=1448321 RepID=A0A317WLW0_9EURO|nr:uncharacterized protein BO70DRAFT_394345 [Aspergillus heteromorphus CBS 117.55]PWY87454.1 hypothetical protein BO70DRAFT_394345 [Aspergillus heteromorphus CBS 117.55]
MVEADVNTVTLCGQYDLTAGAFTTFVITANSSMGDLANTAKEVLRTIEGKDGCGNQEILLGQMETISKHASTGETVGHDAEGLHSLRITVIPTSVVGVLMILPFQYNRLEPREADVTISTQDFVDILDTVEALRNAEEPVKESEKGVL